MRFGAEVTGAGVSFRLWAPYSKQATLAIAGEKERRPMQRHPDGFHEIHVEGARPGMLYTFTLADGMTIPDPASRFQPQDVHGPS